MKLFKGARASGKTTWLAKQIANAPSGKHIYFIAPNNYYLHALADRLDELGGCRGTLEIVVGEAQAMCGSWANEILHKKDTCMVCIDELSAVISQCGENELKTLCRIIAEVDEVYATDTIPETAKRQPAKREGMSAADYIIAKQKMCESVKFCEKCPIFSEEIYDCGDKTIDEKEAEDCVARVARWAAENLIETRSQVFLDQNPNAKTENGIPIICPPSVDRNEKCTGGACRSCLSKYWNAEVTK